MTSTASQANFAASTIDALIQSNRGDHHAFAFNGKRYSYNDVAALMNRTANLLKSLGLAPGDRVLVLLPPSPAFVAAVLGSLKAGLVPVTGIDSAEEAILQRIMAQCHPAAAIVHEKELAANEGALSTLAKDAVIVVGNDRRGYASFVEALREQPSWITAEPIDARAPALSVWTGRELQVLDHRELERVVHGAEHKPLGNITAMLSAFARGEEARLGP